MHCITMVNLQLDSMVMYKCHYLLTTVTTQNFPNGRATCVLNTVILTVNT
jgi:hypothetical protein